MSSRAASMSDRSTGDSIDRDTTAFIDVLRGFAAFMVLLGHSLGMVVKSVYGSDEATVPPVWRWVLSSLGFGGFWVWAFFVLSGLCIQQSVARSLDRRSFTFGGYMLARVTRIYPLFFTGLLMAISGLWIIKSSGGDLPGISVRQLIGSLFMAQLFTGTLYSFGASWSLTNEMAYYLLWPAGLWLARWSSRRALMVLGIGSLAMTAALVVVWKLVYGGDAKHWLVPCWGLTAPLMIWLGGAWLGDRWKQTYEWMTGRRLIAGLIWLGLVYVAVVIIMHRHMAAWTLMTAGYLSIPGFIALVAGARFINFDADGKFKGFADWMGSLSYPCYILHGPLLMLTETLFIPLLHPAIRSSALLLLAALLLPVLLVVGTVGVRLEMFLMQWRKSLLSRPVSGTVVANS